MNERIHKLAEQADLYARSDNSSMLFENFQKRYTEKFVELIVQECTNLLFDESERLYAYSSECDNMRESDEAELVAEKCVDLITMIEEHFGVER